MTEEHTEDQTPDEAPKTAAGDTVPGSSSTPGPSSTSNRDWVIPVSVLGGLLVAALVFAAGFGVGRATTDDRDMDQAGHVVVVPINPGDRGPRDGGYGFGDFGRRGPRMGGDLGEMRGLALDRACTLLDEGAIPDQAPFIDRLNELCEARGA